jgi:hypothetical protein
MSTETSVSLQYHGSGIYEQTLTSAQNAAFEQLVEIMEQVIACHPTNEPMYLVQDASALDLAYTPRVRVFMESLSQRLHRSGKTVRVAMVLPLSFGTCIDFLNCLLRQRETVQSRHMCCTTREEAFAWLQTIQFSESLPAVQGF